jgi:hypothetical protein
MCGKLHAALIWHTCDARTLQMSLLTLVQLFARSTWHQQYELQHNAHQHQSSSSQGGVLVADAHAAAFAALLLL